MRHRLLTLVGLFVAAQAHMNVPAIAQITLDIEPKSQNFAFSAPVVHYLRVAPKTASDPEQLRVCVRLAATTATPLQLTNVMIAIAGNQLNVPLSPAIAIVAGNNKPFWWDKFQGSTTPSQCLLIDLPAPPTPTPNTGTLTLSFAGGTSPQTTQFWLKAHDAPVYAFPGLQGERRPGEFWIANSTRHAAGAEGSQLFAYDMGVVGFDAVTNSWSECFPGVVCKPCSSTGCQPDENPTLKNTDYRIWGTPIHAMADGKVIEFMNNVSTNTTVGKVNAGICGIQGAGNHFYIDHGGDTVLYAHMQPGTLTSSLLTVGALVKKGDVLGLAGNAGTASNPHLHIHAMIGQLAIPPGGCLSEVSPLLLRPLAFSDAYALDVTAVDPTTFTGPWVKLDKMGPPAVASLIRAYGTAIPSGPFDIVELAIDPMALILPPKWYVIWAELRHPHEPKIAEIQQVLQSMTPEEQKTVLDRAKTLGNYGKTVEEALAKMQK